MKRSSLIAATVAFGALSAPGAKADVTSFFGINPFPISQYQTAYMTLGGGVLVRRVPKFNVPFSATGSADPLFSTGASIITGGGGFTIGFRLDRLGIGIMPRIEVAFGGWTGGASKTGGEGFNSTTYVAAIDGSVVSICGGCDGTTTVKMRHTELGGVLRLKTDFPVAPRFTVTPSIGFLGSYSQTRYQSNTPFFFNNPNFLPPHALKETVGARRMGGEVGLDVVIQPAPRWAIEAGAAFAFFALHTSLEGNDCFSGNQPNTLPCSGSNFATSIERSDTRFAFRVSMSLAATYDAGWLKLSVKGFGAWDNAMPGVRNPTSLNGAAAGSASIYYSSQWAYGGAILATFPFFR
jgi:hypothetical protein